MKNILLYTTLTFLFLACKSKVVEPNVDNKLIYATKVETIQPIVINDWSKCEDFTFQSNPITTANYDYFSGISDTDGQVDVQVAVGGNYVFHATNSGLSVFDKNGTLLKAVKQSCLNDGIDPKLFFDLHNKIFAIDFWHYYDDAKQKPLNLSVSATDNPLGKWNTYPISLKEAVDGGGLGYSKKWLAYAYPKDNNAGGTLVMATKDAKNGVPTKVYHFDKEFGQPVFGQDSDDDIYFLAIDDKDLTLHKITTDTKDVPHVVKVWQKPHSLKYVSMPPPSPQKGTASLLSSGDRNPKNVVLQGGYLWFAHTVDFNHAAVQWHQINLKDGAIIQTGMLEKANSNYIQSTIAVNTNLDVLVGCQEVNKNSYVSPRFASRKATDAQGTLSNIVTVETGKGNYGDGTSKTNPWGDYSGSIIDGDNKKDFWTVQNIMEANKKVACRIVKVKQ